ncbi:fungal specific transcription factor domain-containing protein [Colletotrichum musicola]|uniref:Fungal specific transcription factor domain-containing protein n=1 Tax=Colletotrichum musicola TaxID=2175873 RepID=A0A8H6NEW8_9PEZI|nr:fungal specific transcription factor domain-containing protein [Colletotrichum musicola]
MSGETTSHLANRRPPEKHAFSDSDSTDRFRTFDTRNSIMRGPSTATGAPLAPPWKKVTSMRCLQEEESEVRRSRAVLSMLRVSRQWCKYSGVLPPAPSSMNPGFFISHLNSLIDRLQPYTRRQPSRKKPQAATSARKDTPETCPPSKFLSVSQGQNEASAPDFDDVEPGDASVHAFLARLSNHLAQIGQGLSRNLFKRPEEHDVNDSILHTQNLILPPKDAGKMCLDAYFEHGNATCRFLPPREAYGLFEKLYGGAVELSSYPATEALVLLIMATGCVWTASWKNEPLSPWRERALDKVSGKYPPTMRILQAYVVKAMRSGPRPVQQRLDVDGLGRPTQPDGQPTKRAGNGTNPPEAHHKRALFWAMFMMDRYLAIILGRPSAIHERDVTVALSDIPDEEVAASLDLREKKLLIGSVAHYRLVKIMAKAACELYPASKPPACQMSQIVSSLEQDLQRWLKDTPEFFHPGHERPWLSPGSSFYEVPWILKRQQQTIHSAYHFANMLVYRGYLLREFLERPRHGQKTEESLNRIRKCVDSAVAMVNLACAEFDIDEGRYNGTFWSTSHFIFCALSILLVYLTLRGDSSDDDRVSVERAVREGMRFHRKLDHWPNANAQRLLDGSQSQIANTISALGTPGSGREAVRSDAVPAELSGSQGAEVDGEPTPASSSHPQGTIKWPTQWSQELMGESIFDLAGDQVGSPEPCDTCTALTHTGYQGIPGFGSMGGFDMIMDIGFDNTTLLEASKDSGAFRF